MPRHQNSRIHFSRTIIGFLIAPLVGGLVLLVLVEGVHILTDARSLIAGLWIGAMHGYPLTLLFALPVYKLLKTYDKVTSAYVLFSAFAITAVPCLALLLLGQSSVTWIQIGTEVHVRDGKTTAAGIQHIITLTLTAGLSGVAGGLVFLAVRKIKL